MSGIRLLKARSRAEATRGSPDVPTDRRNGVSGIRGPAIGRPSWGQATSPTGILSIDREQTGRGYPRRRGCADRRVLVSASKLSRAPKGTGRPDNTTGRCQMDRCSANAREWRPTNEPTEQITRQETQAPSSGGAKTHQPKD